MGPPFVSVIACTILNLTPTRLAKAEGSLHTDVRSSKMPRRQVSCSHTSAINAALCTYTDSAESTRLEQQHALKPTGSQYELSTPGRLTSKPWTAEVLTKHCP